jgi:hypothetical protein
MMAGNLSIEQRKWILKQYWKTQNAEQVRTAWGTGCVPQLSMTSRTEFRVPVFIGPDTATPPAWTHSTPNHFYVPYADRQGMKDYSNRKLWSNCHIVHDTDHKT